MSTAGYDLAHYVGSVRETAAGDGTLVPFLQRDHRHFVWNPVPAALDHTDATPVDYGTADVDITLPGVPPDVIVRVNGNWQIADITAGSFFYFVHGGATSGGSPVSAAAPLATGSNVISRGDFDLLTDTSQQIVFRTNTGDNMELHMHVHGYENLAIGRI